VSISRPLAIVVLAWSASPAGAQTVHEKFIEVGAAVYTQTCEVYYCRELEDVLALPENFVKATPAVTAGFGVYGARRQIGLMAEAVIPLRAISGSQYSYKSPLRKMSHRDLGARLLIVYRTNPSRNMRAEFAGGPGIAFSRTVTSPICIGETQCLEPPSSASTMFLTLTGGMAVIKDVGAFSLGPSFRVTFNTHDHPFYKDLSAGPVNLMVGMALRFGA
jgi:hypothetical protein